MSLNLGVIDLIRLTNIDPFCIAQTIERRSENRILKRKKCSLTLSTRAERQLKTAKIMRMLNRCCAKLQVCVNSSSLSNTKVLARHTFISEPLSFSIPRSQRWMSICHKRQFVVVWTFCLRRIFIEVILNYFAP